MGALSEKRLAMVDALVKTLPVSILRPLDSSLSLSHDPQLSDVRRIVAQELESHAVKAQVFRPFIPLFQTRDDGIEGVLFPNWVLDRLWRAMERVEAGIMGEVRTVMRGLRSGDQTPVVFYRAVSAGAELIRLQPEEILPQGADVDDAATLAEFADYLDLHRLLREALLRVPDWMGRIDAEKAAAMRLAFKDASAKSESGGVRFLETLYANFDDPALVMKFVSTVTDRPTDKFLSESELAVFGERLLHAAEERLKVFETIMRRKGREPAALGEAGGWIAQCLSLLQVLQQSVEMTREGPWGKRAGRIHQTISGLVEDRLKTVEKTIDQALPIRSERIFGRATREIPDYDGPKPEQAELALQTVAFLNQIRPAASQGGYASLLTKTVQAAEKVMDDYFERVLAVAVGDEPFDPQAVMTCFDRVIALMEGLLGETKGNLVRRRVAAADVWRAQKPITPKTIA
ncbi:MAG: hypothetical protein QM667_07675 [Asticcacaulis sp.]